MEYYNGSNAGSTRHRPITLESAFFAIAEKYPWTAIWLREFEIIVAAPSIRNPSHAMSTKDYKAGCPPYVTALGCRGVFIDGSLSWIGFDLDVGHGNTCYDSTEAALVDAHKLRDFFDGFAEIRHSKGGLGVHVRHLLPDDSRPADEGPKIAKIISKKLGLRADPSSLGRQCHWLWTRNPVPSSFKLIAPHEGINYAD